MTGRFYCARSHFFAESAGAGAADALTAGAAVSATAGTAETAGTASAEAATEGASAGADADEASEAGFAAESQPARAATRTSVVKNDFMIVVSLNVQRLVAVLERASYLSCSGSIVQSRG